jgi:hypothetical protein
MIGAVDYALPSNDDVFAASTAGEWNRLMPISDSNNGGGAQRSKPFHELAASVILSDPDAAFSTVGGTGLGRQALIGSVFAVVLSTRATRPSLDADQEADPQGGPLRPLKRAMDAAYHVVPPLGVSDTFASGVLWNIAWMHLYVDMRQIELACGREGLEATSIAMDRLSSWVTTVRARKTVLHAVDVGLRVKSLHIGQEATPHLLCSALQACKRCPTYFISFCYLFLTLRLQGWSSTHISASVPATHRYSSRAVSTGAR